MMDLLEEDVAMPVRITREVNSQLFNICVINTGSLLKQAQHLRYQVYRNELNCSNIPYDEQEIESDVYDHYCDHLVVYSVDRQCVVGTYRLMRFDQVNPELGFYTESEFNLLSLKKQHPSLCEIGRACVHPDFRNGSVIGMLWQGVMRYSEYYRIDTLMGCASVEGDAAVVSKVYAYAHSIGALLPESLSVNPKNPLDGFSTKINGDARKAKREVPALIRAYFSIGAKIAPNPCYDAAFKLTDFFVLFSVKDNMKKMLRFFR